MRGDLADAFRDGRAINDKIENPLVSTRLVNVRDAGRDG
jgi:hypothetical protein